MKVSNKELDRFMAEKVMGWYMKPSRVHPHSIHMDLVYYWYDNNSKRIISVGEWRPSEKENLNQAMECVEEVKTKQKVEFEFFQADDSYYYWARIDGKSEGLFSKDKSPARAVCLALKAFAESREGE